jgi:DNA-binding NtrC family response regulator
VNQANRLRVLVVENDQNERNALVQVVAAQHDVITAATGAEALEVCVNRAIDVVCTAHQMPGMTGLDLISTMNERGIRLGAVLITTTVDVLRAAAARNFENLFFTTLLKPFPGDRLLMVIRRAGMFTRMNRSVRAAHRSTERLRTGEWDLRDVDVPPDEPGDGS